MGLKCTACRPAGEADGPGAGRLGRRRAVTGCRDRGGAWYKRHFPEPCGKSSGHAALGLAAAPAGHRRPDALDDLVSFVLGNLDELVLQVAALG